MSPSGKTGEPNPGSVQAPGWQRALPWAVALASVAALALVLLLGVSWGKVPPPDPMKLSVDLGLRGEPLLPAMSYIALSPDGRTVAFAAAKWFDSTTRLYVRSFGSVEAVLLPGTNHALNPFFSPDGRWIAFFADNQLKKIAVTGGSAIPLCAAPEGRGGNWGEDGFIVFSPDKKDQPLLRVSSDGGTPESLTTLQPREQTQRWPQILPGGKAVLFTSLSPAGNDFDFALGNLVVQTLPSGPRTVVKRGATFGRYVPSGHLLYSNAEGTVFAVPFDLKRLEVTGSPQTIAEKVISNALAGSTMFATSTTGVFAYVRQFLAGDVRPITWLDRSGDSSMFRATPSAWGDFAFDPDGQKLAFTAVSEKQVDIWVQDVKRDAPARLTNFNANSGSPVWTPDGRRMTFSSLRGEKDVARVYNLYWLPVDGSAGLQQLTTSPNEQKPNSWHPTERILAFTEVRSGRSTIMILRVDGDERSGWRPGNPTVFFNEDFDQRAAAFSPKGDWLAYESNQSGEYNIYVRPFPGPGPQVQISTAGGVFPIWSRKRSELIYESLDQQVMIASYSIKDGAFHPEQSRPWPQGKVTAQRGRSFALHPDGERLLLPAAGGAPAPKWERLELVLNFFDELRRIAPPPGR